MTKAPTGSPPVAMRGRSRLRLERRWANAALVLVLLAAAALHLAAIDGGQTWSGDWALYVLHAKSIATGAPYAETGYIQNPKFFLGPQEYPPGLPLLLAPIYASFGMNLYLMEGLMVVLFLASIAITARMVWDEGPRWQPVALAALLGFSPFLWKFSQHVTSDVPFLFWASLSLWGIRRMHAGEERRRAAWWAAGAGLCVYAATITRPFGPVLILSVVVLDLVRARRITWQTGVLLAACALGYGAHQLAAFLYAVGGAGEAGGALVDHKYSGLVARDLLGRRLAQLPGTMLSTGTDYLRHTLSFWYNGYALWPTRLLGVLGLVAAAVGWAWRAWQRLSILEVFAAFYVLFLLPWSFSDGRYLLPVIPLYFFYVLVGAGRLRQWMGRRLPLRRLAAPRAWLEAAVVAAALVSYGAHFTAPPPYTLPTDPSEPAAQRFFEHVRLHTSPDAVFIFRKPRVLALYTGRAAATYRDARNKPDDDAEMLRHFDRTGARYIVAGPPDEAPVLQDLARRHPERLTLVHRDGHFKMYRFKPGS